MLTETDHAPFQAEYKSVLAESFRSDAEAMEKQMAQKWVKIIKNALIARRLKHEFSTSMSEQAISDGQKSIDSSSSDAGCISTFAKGSMSNPAEPEIDEFEAI